MEAFANRIRGLLRPAKDSAEEYEPLTEDDSETLERSISATAAEAPFSWVEYFIFALIGVAMLWAWNMFLAAAPYFQTRLESDPWVSAKSQPAILTTFTVLNLAAMLILTNLQSKANYPLRINAAMVINAAIFCLLTLSTSAFLDASPRAYLAFILLMVAASALATGLMQNGAFSFAASFGRPEYTQAIMAGQGVAGVLPSLTQILSFLAFSDSPPPSSTTTNAPPNTIPYKGGSAAFTYFLTAVLISLATLLAFIPLVRRRAARLSTQQSATTPTSASASASTFSLPRGPPRGGTSVPLPTLFRKLRWLVASVFMCFVVAMFFPVLTAKVLSVHDAGPGGGSTSRIFRPGAFIPLGFFAWNLGDLAGRVLTAKVGAPLRRRPKVLFAISLLRWGFLPLYGLCNLHGAGAVVRSDLFYLVGVQFPFGLTNGWLGSSSMMAAGEWVGEGERAAAGGFMSLCLVAGLAAGSVLSFSVAGV